MPAPSPSPLPPYAYRCVDRSLLTPAFRRRVVPAFMDWIPVRVPANFITLASSACMWTALALAAARDAIAPAALALALAVLLFLYLVYDQVDGMHAKRTGTSSALGEFLDHYLDVYHGAITVLAVFALAGFDRPLLVAATLWSTHLAFAATMLEERERKELVFGALGSLEGVLLFVAFALSWLVPPVRAWWLAPLVGDWPAYALLVLAGGVGSVATAAGCLRRIGRMPAAFALYAAASLALAAWAGTAPVPFWAGMAVVVCYGGDYTGRLIGSHLLGRPAPWPDPVAPAALAAGWFAGAEVAAPLVPALLGWTALRAAWTSLSVFLALRHLWRWRNPDRVAV